MTFLLNIQKRWHAIQLSEVQKVLSVWVLKCVCQKRGHNQLSEGQACSGPLKLQLLRQSFMLNVRRALLEIFSGMKTIYQFTLCQRKALGLSSFLGTYWNVKVLRHKQINKRVNCFPETQFDCKLIQFLRQGWQKINCFALCLWMPRPEKHVVPWEKAVAPGWEPDRELQDQLCHSLSLGTHWTPQSQFPSL